MVSAPGTATETETVAAETLEGIDQRRNHPLYLHPSDNPGSVLITVHLTGMENYSLCSRSMLINLQAKSKLRFVLGTCKRSDYQGELGAQWENAMHLCLHGS